MERPYAGRAVVTETIRGVVIEIPVKRNWFVILFFCAWLGGWLLGELFALSTVLGIDASFSNPATLFMIVWLVAWSVGGLFAIRIVIWMIMGKEIISFEDGVLKVERKGALFSSPKQFDMREVKNFSVNTVSEVDMFMGFSPKKRFLSIGDSGALKFDYGLKTIRVASGIDEAEAKYLLNMLISKQIVKEQ